MQDPGLVPNLEPELPSKPDPEPKNIIWDPQLMTAVRDIRSTKFFQYIPSGQIYDSELIVLKRVFSHLGSTSGNVKDTRWFCQGCLSYRKDMIDYLIIWIFSLGFDCQVQNPVTVVTVAYRLWRCSVSVCFRIWIFFTFRAVSIFYARCIVFHLLIKINKN